MIMAAHAVCLVIAGMMRAIVPAEDFTLAWQHSVQKTRWEEHYRVDDDALVLVEARVQGSGAGMEAGDQAAFRDGWWIWQPGRRIPELALSASEFTPDHLLCTARGCRPLRDVVRGGDGGEARTSGPVILRACTSP